MERQEMIKKILETSSKNGNDFYSFGASDDVNEWNKLRVVALNEESLNKLNDIELNEVLVDVTEIARPKAKAVKERNFEAENKRLMKKLEKSEKEIEALQNNITDLCKQYDQLNTKKIDKESVFKMVLDSGHDDEVKLRIIKNLL